MTNRLWLVVLSLVVVIGLVASACAAPQPEAPPEAPPKAPPEPKEPFQLGVTGAMTGYAGGTYLPGIEYMRCSFEKLNDEGGIDGRMVEVTIEDNRGEPPRAISQVKSFIERDQAPLVLVHSPSATYSGVMAECERANIPLIIGASGTEKELPPDPHPLFFDGFYSSLYDSATLMAHFLRGYDAGPIKIGLLGMDIPVSRAATQGFGEACVKLGIEVVYDFIPPGATDLTAVASKFKAEGINYCEYHGPGEVSQILYDSLTKLGWEGTLLTAFYASAENAMEAAKARDIDILYFGHYSLFQMDTPGHREAKAMLEKYKASEINSMSLFGCTNAPVIEQIYREAGYPVTTDKALEVMNNLEYNAAPLYGTIKWTETDHKGPAYGVLYVIHGDGTVTQESNWFMTDALGETLEDLGPELPGN